jgi:hypothetical protein
MGGGWCRPDLAQALDELGVNRHLKGMNLPRQKIALISKNVPLADDRLGDLDGRFRFRAAVPRWPPTPSANPQHSSRLLFVGKLDGWRA